MAGAWRWPPLTTSRERELDALLCSHGETATEGQVPPLPTARKLLQYLSPPELQGDTGEHAWGVGRAEHWPRAGTAGLTLPRPRSAADPAPAGSS